MADIILIILLLGGYLWLHMSSRKNKKGPKKEKAADWFQVKKLDEDGLITTQDDRYMYMLEVQPVSFALKSPMEQKMIWSAFRDCINMITHPIRFKTESHPYDLEDYFQELRAQAIETDDVANTAYVEEMRDLFTKMLEQNQIQDRKYFVFLETDTRFLSELNAEISNPILHDLLKKNVKKSVSHDMDTVRQELSNSLRIIQSTFHNVGIWTTPMQRQDVLEYMYRTANRDIAGLLPLDEMLARTAVKGEPVQSFGKTIYGGEAS